MNRITIEPTKFVNVRDNTETYGYRMYDDHSQTYYNCLDSIPDDNLEFLKAIISSLDDTARYMIDFVIENETSIMIGDDFYTWEQIKPILLKD